MSFQILQRAYAPYGTAAQFPASGDPRLIYRATDTGYLYTWDASESAYKLVSISPDHTHNYAGSSTPGGAATTALACTGNAATATTADDSSKLGGQAPAYYLDRTNHTGTQPASSISDFAATTRSTVATGMVTTTPEAALETDTLVAIVGRLQSQLSALQRNSYILATGGEPMAVNLSATGDGTGVLAMRVYSDVRTNASLTSGAFYSDSSGATSLGQSITIAARTDVILYVKLQSGDGVLSFSSGCSLKHFGTLAGGFFTEATNAPKLVAFDIKYWPWDTSFFAVNTNLSMSTITGSLQQWPLCKSIYVIAHLATLTGALAEWASAERIVLQGLGLSMSISGAARPWLNAARVSLILPAASVVTVDLSASCRYTGSAGLDVYLDGTGISVSYPISRAWPTVFNRIHLRPAYGTMPSADVDRLCNDLATYTTSATGNKVLDLRGACGVATSASATARAYLAGLGISVSVNT